MPAGYGLLGPEAGSGLVPWSRVDERLAAARNYWLATTRPDGRPHVMPVWGVWLERALWFGTDRGSRKARNLARNAAVAVHLESGDDVVILEGAAGEVRAPEGLREFDRAYAAKYAVRLADIPGEVSVWAVRPRTAFAWVERDFPGSATRWALGDPA
jgi:hypothetical protein